MDPKRLRATFEARHSCVRIVTQEEAEIVDVALEAARQMRLDAIVWSVTEGVHRRSLMREESAPSTSNPAQGLRWLAQNIKVPTMIITLDAADQLQDTVNLRAFRDLMEGVRAGSIGAGMVQGPAGGEGQMLRSVILMIDHNDRVPPVIGAASTRYEIQPPDDTEIGDIVKRTLQSVNRARSVKNEITQENKFRDALVANLRGLTRRQVRQIVAEIASDGRLTDCDLDQVQRSKRALLESAGVLEFIEAPTTLDDIGGLSRLKDWLSARARSFETSAESFGLLPPRGVLLLGVQGAGKSLAAKAIATAWRRPLMRLDAGSLFNKYIGETERNLRDALSQAEAMSPVILWIDEIEKGFSSMGSGEDGGVSRRMFGTLLTWMQEHKTPVFLVATANDIEQLPPELMRKGRFDEIFFADLPTAQVRETIFRIHLRKRKQNPGQFDLAALAEAADGFSGAEIEQAVLSALHRAYSAGRSLTQADVVEAVRGSPPLSVTRQEAIEELRAWARGRCVPAD
jgi:ATP-dependent 26S proteasome regulatory subunit